MAKVKPIPDGYPQVIPYLSIDGAGDAIEFYSNVFGPPSACAWARPAARSATPSSRSATRS